LLKTQPRTTELGETMAMTMAELGNYPEALAIQRDIIDTARRARLTRDVERMQRNLMRYERGEPCREPGW
jgi:hypothetical protein